MIEPLAKDPGSIDRICTNPMRLSIAARLAVSLGIGVTVSLISIWVIAQREHDVRAVARVGIALNEVHSDGLARTNDLKFSWNQRSMPMELLRTIGMRDAVAEALARTGLSSVSENVEYFTRRTKVRFIPGTQAIEVSVRHRSESESLLYVENLIEVEVQSALKRKERTIDALITQLQHLRVKALNRLEATTEEMASMEASKAVAPLQVLGDTKSKLVEVQVERHVQENLINHLKELPAFHFAVLRPWIPRERELDLRVDDGAQALLERYLTVTTEQEVIGRRYGSESLEFKEKDEEVRVIEQALKEMKEAFESHAASQQVALEQSQRMLERELELIERSIIEVNELERSFSFVRANLELELLHRQIGSIESRIGELNVSRNALQPHLYLLDSAHVERMTERAFKQSAYVSAVIGGAFLALAVFLMTDGRRNAAVF